MEHLIIPRDRFIQIENGFTLLLPDSLDSELLHRQIAKAHETFTTSSRPKSLETINCSFQAGHTIRQTLNHRRIGETNSSGLIPFSQNPAGEALSKPQGLGLSTASTQAHETVAVQKEENLRSIHDQADVMGDDNLINCSIRTHDKHLLLSSDGQEMLHACTLNLVDVGRVLVAYERFNKFYNIGMIFNYYKDNPSENVAFDKIYAKREEYLATLQSEPFRNALCLAIYKNMMEEYKEQQAKSRISRLKEKMLHP